MPRFGRTERFAHWWTVAMVSVALISGLALGDEARSGPMLIVHAGAVALIFVGLIGAAAFGNRDALLRAARRLFTFDSQDVAWVREHARRPFTASSHYEWGLFNTGQKLLATTLAVSMTAVIATGIQSWASRGEGGLHGATVVLTAVLLGAHIFMAVLNPSTRPALRGMVFGRVRRSWAARHHSAWLASLDDTTARRPGR